MLPRLSLVVKAGPAAGRRREVLTKSSQNWHRAFPTRDKFSATIGRVQMRPFTFDEAEFRLRRVLAEEGYAQPDEVSRGPDEDEITFTWEGHDPPITMNLADHPERVDRIEEDSNGRPASVAEVTARMSKIIADGGIRKPDAIREGPEPHEVSFIWAQEKALVIIDRREDLEEMEPA